MTRRETEREKEKKRDEETEAELKVRRKEEKGEKENEKAERGLGTHFGRGPVASHGHVCSPPHGQYLPTSILHI